MDELGVPQDARAGQRLRRARSARAAAVAQRRPPRDRRPAPRHRLRPAHRRWSRRQTAPTSSCASATPTAARPAPAATPRAASRAWSWPRPAETASSSRPSPASCDGAPPAAGRVASTWARPASAGARSRWREHATRCTCRSRSARSSDPVGGQMGNPHAVFFVADVEAVDLAQLGPVLEHHPLFPERANIGVARCASPRPHPPAGLGARRRHHRWPAAPAPARRWSPRRAAA